MTWLHTVIDVPPALHAVSGQFWSRALGWPVGAPWRGHPELSSFEPATGGTYVHLQRIGDAPRVHLDVESDDPDATVSAAVAGGAELISRFERWVALRSPGGLPFCVVRARSRVAPGPTTWADGHRSRLMQVCVDSPATRHDSEVAFWRSLLRGRWVASASEEFAGTWHGVAGSPLQLLFQRLGEPEGNVRAHLDLGTDDRAAEVQRLLGLGAEDDGAGRGWHVLRDPAGMAFCVTDNSP